MKIARYELKVVYKKELILTVEDDVDSEELLKIFLETQVKEEKEQDRLFGIIAEKISEEGCTEQCESCQKYCPASEECMETDENVRCTNCEYLCETCGICELKELKSICFSASKSSDTRNSETGAEEYTIPASNAFGLPHRFSVCQSSGSLSGRIHETLRKWKRRK